ncbi:MAG: DUF721 domain-containing protein [Pseudomonadales bacterium]|nr:DUF721 domain-containing protein [Pseudomonadales bacterium]
MKRPSQILDRPTSTLHHVYAHSQQLLKLQAIVRNLVPGEIYVASCENGSLHIITSSSGLATRLRYRQRALVSSLRRKASHWDIEEIRISVRPETGPAARENVNVPIPPSPENARQLLSTAKYIEDEALRKALIGLARRAQSDQK